MNAITVADGPVKWQLQPVVVDFSVLPSIPVEKEYRNMVENRIKPNVRTPVLRMILDFVDFILLSPL
jgi:hypothetical protein